jgi:hypothetical protein
LKLNLIKYINNSTVSIKNGIGLSNIKIYQIRGEAIAGYVPCIIQPPSCCVVRHCVGSLKSTPLLSLCHPPPNCLTLSTSPLSLHPPPPNCLASSAPPSHCSIRRPIALHYLTPAHLPLRPCLSTVLIAPTVSTAAVIDSI